MPNRKPEKKLEENFYILKKRNEKFSDGVRMKI